MNAEQTYQAFMAALTDFIKRGGYGTQGVVAAEANINNSYLSQVVSGVKMAGFKTQVALANACGYSYPDFLVLGQHLGKQNSHSDISIKSKNIPSSNLTDRPIIIQVNGDKDADYIHAENYRAVPLYESGKLAAWSNGRPFDLYEEPVSEVMVYLPELAHRGHHKLVAVRVGGDSMDPTIPEKSIVIVDLDERDYEPKRIYAINKIDDVADVAAVKRVWNNDDGFLLLSDNPAYPPVSDAREWYQLCIGRVVWMWRSVLEA